ncbi:EF-hand domain-containing protein [Sphingomonas sp. DT-204]|uniref:EF-hand domain-containing protein n=1 Tax=Sphingomonas sp. DT-204 TaxID=3396166 RepID=UPI003F1B878E
MLRYLAGVVSALLLVGAGVFLFRSSASPEATPVPRMLVAGTAGQDAPAAETELPAASARTREEKRFARYDKDKNGQVAREEYFASRRKAFAKLDRDGDGRLSFDEWAAKTTDKFAKADKDGSGVLTPAEFAATAVKRSPQRRVPCPPQRQDEAD